MTFTCDSCGHSRPGPPIVSVTGRDLCQECTDRTNVTAATVIFGGGPSEVIASYGWWKRLRKARGTES